MNLQLMPNPIEIDSPLQSFGVYYPLEAVNVLAAEFVRNSPLSLALGSQLMVKVAPRRKSILCNSPLAACSNASQRQEFLKLEGARIDPSHSIVGVYPDGQTAEHLRPSSRSAKAILAAL